MTLNITRLNRYETLIVDISRLLRYRVSKTSAIFDSSYMTSAIYRLTWLLVFSATDMDF